MPTQNVPIHTVTITVKDNADGSVDFNMKVEPTPEISSLGTPATAMAKTMVAAALGLSPNEVRFIMQPPPAG